MPAFTPTSMTGARVQPISFAEHTLANGLHVIVHEDHASPIVTVSVWYHVGSRDEEPGRTGFAHLFEHLMFQGSDNVRKQEHFKYIHEVGGTLNASTSADRTNYFQTVPSQYLALALWLESDRMRSLAVTRENFENEREVVKEERRQRYDNVPYGTLFERLLANVFRTSGYRWSTIGSMEDLDRATIDDVRAFHSRYYVPNNATLVLAGDVDPDSARRLVEEYFLDIPRGDAVAHAPVDEPMIAGPLRDTTVEHAPHALVAIAMHAPPDTHLDAIPTMFLAEMLGEGESSPLHRRLVRDERIASAVSVNPILFESAGLLLVHALAAEGVDPQRLEHAVWEELQNARAIPPSEHLLEKARNAMLKHLVEWRGTVFHRSQALSRAHVYFGDAGRVNDEWHMAEGVSSADVHRVAELLQPEHSVTVTMLPSAAHE